MEYTIGGKPRSITVSENQRFSLPLPGEKGELSIKGAFYGRLGVDFKPVRVPAPVDVTDQIKARIQKGEYAFRAGDITAPLPERQEILGEPKLHIIYNIAGVPFDNLYSANMKVDFKSYDRGRGTGVVGINELKRMIEQRLEVSSKIIAVKPERMEFSYNNGECRRVPIRWAGRVIPDQLYFISHVEYLPDSVDIYASREKLDSIRVVYTEALNYVNFRDTLTVECQLDHLNDVKIVPERVQIRFHTDVLTEETMSNIPIQCVNLPAGKVLRTFPRYAKVHFVAGASQIRNLRAEDFKVVADYHEIELSHKEKCNLYLREVPQGVSRATLNTKQVDYLIEEEE